MRKFLPSFPLRSECFSAFTLLGRNDKSRSDYMGMGWLILGLTYQQGELPKCGNSEWTQVAVCSGFRASTSYSVLPFFSGIARMRRDFRDSKGSAGFGWTARLRTDKKSPI